MEKDLWAAAAGFWVYYHLLVDIKYPTALICSEISTWKRYVITGSTVDFQSA